MSTKELILTGIIVIAIALVVLGVVSSKSNKGRKVHEKLEAYYKISKAASAEATKQENLTGEERKQWAVDFAVKELGKLGYKKPSVDLLYSTLEQCYTEAFKLYNTAYNWGLATNTDGSERDAFKDEDGNGVADFKEDYVNQIHQLTSSKTTDNDLAESDGGEAILQPVDIVVPQSNTVNAI